MAKSESTEEILDVAIVGGGISGVYSAWRLMTAGLPPSMGMQNVCVFEGTDRIGGRLLSLTPPGMPHIRCELGGMRYMSSHTLVRSLVENKFKFTTRPLPVDEPNNIAYLRGQHLRLQELTDPAKVPYRLPWSERGKNPGDLVAGAMDQIIPGVNGLHGDELQWVLRNVLVEGKHIYDHGFWNLLALSLSHEGYDFAQQSGGYDTTGLNWNAADTIVLNFDFAPGVTFSALVDGFEQVPIRLCEEFQAAGGRVEYQTHLKSFDAVTLPDGTEGLALKFGAGPWPPEDGVDDSGATVVRLARRLILAMPRRSLEMLDETGPVLARTEQNRPIREMIESVTPIPLFKLFVCYGTPWWQAAAALVDGKAVPLEGRSVTDLPIRQCYYWGEEAAHAEADPTNRNAVLLASYDDTLNVSFWAGLQDKKERALSVFQPKLNHFAQLHQAQRERAQPGAGPLAWSRYTAPAAMVQEVHRQLMEMHGLRYAPEPYDAAYKDWGDDPFGGGVNFWNIHAKSWELIPAMTQPKPGVPVYVCGEAYSGAQGWAEGALETAELVLQNHFGLPPPDWVTEQPAAPSAPAKLVSVL